GGTSGRSEKSISSSRIRSSRCQSVCECGEIDFFFISCCLPYRDDTNDIVSVGMDHCGERSSQEPEGDEPLLAVTLPFVLDRNRMSFEDRLSVLKVDSMFLEVRHTLVFIPRIPCHCSYSP